MPHHRPLCPSGREALEPEANAPCAEAARPFVLAATILASAMAFIDATVVHIALPAIQSDLDASFSMLQWVANAYALMLGGLILVGGGLGDRLGRRRIFVAGIAIFALASLLCALAPTASTLVAARALQGAGAAMLVPQSLAIIAAAFPKETRGAAIGLWAGASAVTTALGPAIGGALIDQFSWRSVFWINLPLSCAAIWLALAYVPESRDEEARGPLDWLGGLLAVLGFGALSWGVMRLADGADALAMGLMLTGAAAVALFFREEARAAAPLAPPSLFRDRVFLGGNIVTLALYGALGAVLFLLPFELIARRGFSAAETGLTMLPMGLIIGVLSRPMGDLADRYGPRAFLVLGSAMVALASLWLSLAVEGWMFGALAPLILLSLGMAMVVAPLTTTVINAAPDAQAGAASGVNNAASRLAGLLAVALCGAVASAVFVSGLEPAIAAEFRFGELPAADAPDRAKLESSFLNGYAAALWIASASAAAAAAIAAITIPSRSGAAR